MRAGDSGSAGVAVQVGGVGRRVAHRVEARVRGGAGVAFLGLAQERRGGARSGLQGARGGQVQQAQQQDVVLGAQCGAEGGAAESAASDPLPGVRGGGRGPEVLQEAFQGAAVGDECGRVTAAGVGPLGQQVRSQVQVGLDGQCPGVTVRGEQAQAVGHHGHAGPGEHVADPAAGSGHRVLDVHVDHVVEEVGQQVRGVVAVGGAGPVPDHGGHGDHVGPAGAEALRDRGEGPVLQRGDGDAVHRAQFQAVPAERGQGPQLRAEAGRGLVPDAGQRRSLRRRRHCPPPGSGRKPRTGSWLR